MAEAVEASVSVTQNVVPSKAYAPRWMLAPGRRLCGSFFLALAGARLLSIYP